MVTAWRATSVASTRTSGRCRQDFQRPDQKSEIQGWPEVLAMATWFLAEVQSPRTLPGSRPSTTAICTFAACFSNVPARSATDMKLILETDRLLLREFTLEDLEAFCRLVSDPDVTRYTHDGRKSLEEVQDTAYRASLGTTASVGTGGGPPSSRATARSSRAYASPLLQDTVAPQDFFEKIAGPGRRRSVSWRCSVLAG